MGLFQAIRHKPLTERTTSRLNKDLSNLYAESIRMLKANGESALLIQEDVDVLLALAAARERLRIAANRDAEQEVAPVVAEIIDDIQGKLYQCRVPRTRLGLSKAMERLVAASVQLSGVSGPEAGTVETMVIPLDLLLRSKQDLFPASKMQMISGRRVGRTVRLELPIDVTGTSPNAHPKPDDFKLNEAQVSTARSGTFLAMCLHSHLGEGPAATVPDPIDTDQHTYWVNHQWPLLISAIIVKDGYVRLFGDAVERKLLAVVIEGAGVEQVAQDGAYGPGMLYKVTTPEAMPAQATSEMQQDSSEERYASREDLLEFERRVKEMVRSVAEFVATVRPDSATPPDSTEAETTTAKVQG